MCLAAQTMDEIYASLLASDARLEVLIDHIPANTTSKGLAKALKHLGLAAKYVEEAMDAHDHDHPGEIPLVA